MLVSEMLRIGYFVPQFPGQTHSFFWREITALKARGIEPELVSTRRPRANLIAHSWAREAMEKTVYLAPPRARDVAATVAELARTSPAGWRRCAESIRRAEGRSGAARLQLGALVVVGARLAALARARGWAHVHAHSCAQTAEIAMFASLLSGLPYSLTLHAPLGEFGPNHREKWRHARFAVIVTRSLRREVEEVLSESLPPSVDVAPMGVELGSFARRRPYEPWTGHVPLQIFSCGRLNPGKGHQDLIRAVGMLRRRGIDARLTIAGEDEAGGTTHRRVLAAQIAAMDLAGSVALLGAVSEARICAELERAHVFALASLNEAIGVATMEAMAMGTPVVVTGVGGVPELVDDGVSGLLVQPERPAELAAKIERLARDPELAHRIGEAGRRKVESEFNSSKSASVLARHLIEAPGAAWPRPD